MRRLFRLAGLGAALAAAGCRSYSDGAADEVYPEVLHGEGRDDSRGAKAPSEPHWKQVADRKSRTLPDAWRITLTQSERIARAAEGYLQALSIQDQAIAAILPTVSVVGTQFFQDPVPAPEPTPRPSEHQG